MDQSLNFNFPINFDAKKREGKKDKYYILSCIIKKYK